MIQQFRKKPIVIDAVQFTYETAIECVDFIGSNVTTRTFQGQPILVILTLEGEMTARLGDWIIKGVNGEFYPCKPDILEKTYERVQTESFG